MTTSNNAIHSIRSSDVRDLKVSLGLTQHDLAFLYGRALDFSIADDRLIEKDDEVKSITFSVMARVLREEPKSLPIDIMNYEEAFNLIKQYEPDLSFGKFSIYFGLGYWPANDWRRQKSKPSRRVILCFVMVKRLIELYGQEGWELWKRALKEEAVVRGKSFDEVLKDGTWGTSDSKGDE